jgi:cell wall assembly regulator SMI1
MRRRVIIILVLLAGVTVAVIATAFVVLRNVGVEMFAPSRAFFYPPAPTMPAPVATSIEELLARYEKLLAAAAPNVLSSLQPGLTDAQIDALEAKHGFKLTPDLRALYRWRNGTPRNVVMNAFPDHGFAPLEEAIADRDAVVQQVKGLTKAQQATYAAYAGHRDPWLGLIVDAAGDGHFYDPRRTEAQGSFFFHFAEDASYTFYPAFRNYLAETIDGHEGGVYKFGDFGAETADFVKAQTLSDKYGAANEQ